MIKRGRPEKDEEERRDKRFVLLLTSREIDLLYRLALDRDVPASELMREKLHELFEGQV